jgi:hypothetical protein
MITDIINYKFYPQHLYNSFYFFLNYNNFKHLIIESSTSSSSSDDDFVKQIVKFFLRPRVFHDRSNPLMDHGLFIGLCIMMYYVYYNIIILNL